VIDLLAQVVLLLAVTVAVVLACQRWRVPSLLGYLCVGVLLGPHTIGPVVELPGVTALAEFGIVFLLFTIGLAYSPPTLSSMHPLTLWLGAGQVVLTTLVVGALAVLCGVPLPAAFVLGAVCAQSSTTVIARQLGEQGEEHSRHGRLGIALSVFQDVTAVPFVVLIPTLGAGADEASVAGLLGFAALKACAALLLVFVVGRRLLRPLFHVVAARRSAELFTSTVLLVALLAAWITSRFGLSLAFGAFLAGMVLGETEFRHQVEAAVRPFRDVLLGLFFIGIGMLFDPFGVRHHWLVAIAGALVLLGSKVVLVGLLVRMAGWDARTALRTALVLAVGGEFGLALLALALDAGVIATDVGQAGLLAVLLAMIGGATLIRFNHGLAAYLRPAGGDDAEAGGDDARAADLADDLRDHVLVCGYGRIGQSVARFLELERIPFVALDLDARRVREARAAGEPVVFGDAADTALLEALGLDRARLVVISHDDLSAALRELEYLQRHRPDVPVMVRTRDEAHVEQLRRAGAREVVPDTREAGLMIAVQVLLSLDVPLAHVMRRLQEQRRGDFPSLRAFFPAEEILGETTPRDQCLLRAVTLPAQAAPIGRTLGELADDGINVAALVRGGVRYARPALGTHVRAGDVLVLIGTDAELDHMMKVLDV